MFPRTRVLHRVVGLVLIILITTLALATAPVHAGSVLQDDTPTALDASMAVDSLLNYQGRLLNSSTGAPLSGTYTFVFRLYSVATGGTALWSETKDLAVTNGLFATFLGDTNALPTSIFNGQDLWLGVKVGTDAEATPRQRIGAEAYALFSDNAARLAGQSGAFYRSANNINAGTLADARIPAPITRDGEVMTIVLAGDGPGSGLNADLLDNQSSGFYRSANNINAGTLADARIPAPITRDSEVMTIVLAGDGSGSGLNADLLDNQSSGFYRNAININAGTLADARIPGPITRDSEVMTIVLAGDGPGSGLNADLLDNQSSSYYRSATNINAGTLADARIPGPITRDSEVMTIVLAGDGPGSGLNADLLDGQSSTAFAVASHNHDVLYVNTSGDTMSGSGSKPILSVSNTSTASAADGIYGRTASSANGVAGVRGSAGSPGTTITGKHGVLGQSDTGKGVVGVSKDSHGVFGWSTNDWGVRGEGLDGGIYGLSWSPGSDAIRGANTATSGSSWGVVGTSSSPDGRGVVGMIYPSSGQTYGVYGSSNSTDGGAAVRGSGAYVGVWGTSSGRWGVYGSSTGTTNSYGVFGSVSTGTGNYAGYFNGDVRILGNLSQSSGSFKIDHPLDPENKYLSHSFVESPDMMTVFNGNATLDVNGETWVELPAYFEALNRDLRYQLTAIGGPGPNLYVAQEVQNNRFKIAGGAPGLRVSWQVTGIRQDPYANANRIVVEEEKPAEERGSYLHPDLYGQDYTRSVGYRLHGELLSPSTEDAAGSNLLNDTQQQKFADDPILIQPQGTSSP